jgi:hypothetical protein
VEILKTVVTILEEKEGKWEEKRKEEEVHIVY